jgi:hypothetical protein
VGRIPAVLELTWFKSNFIFKLFDHSIKLTVKEYDIFEFYYFHREGHLEKLLKFSCGLSTEMLCTGNAMICF